MDDTEDHKISHIDKIPLSIEQLNAIDFLIKGKTDQETAEAVGVTRETVNRWRNQHPFFKAELNRKRKEIWQTAHERLRSLAISAVEILEKALYQENFKVAIEVLKILSIHSEVKPPSDPTDPELVLWKDAEEWARHEFLKRGPIIEIVSEDMNNGIIRELVYKKMEELRKIHGIGIKAS